MEKCNVLIVDDDRLSRRGIISLLPWEKYGMTVVGDVQNGEKALAFLERHPVDLVFVDLEMPVMDGMTLMERCQSLYPALLFVVLTFHENFEYIRLALQMGALDYISKLRMETEDCEALMQRICEKLRQLQGAPDMSGGGQFDALFHKWKDLCWLYNDALFEQLRAGVLAAHVPVRSLERYLAQFLPQVEDETGLKLQSLPDLPNTEILLEWLKDYRTSLYRLAVQTEDTQRVPVCIIKAMQYARTHIGEPLHTEDVAQAVNLSRSYFSVNFKKATHMTFHEFVRAERIQRAKHLLHHPVAIPELARQVGYEDVNHFTRVFSELTGVTPSEYRKQISRA